MEKIIDWKRTIRAWNLRTLIIIVIIIIINFALLIILKSYDTGFAI